jgi:hypothetical protein
VRRISGVASVDALSTQITSIASRDSLEFRIDSMHRPMNRSPLKTATITDVPGAGDRNMSISMSYEAPETWIGITLRRVVTRHLAVYENAKYNFAEYP